jgi:hypothetical protein
VSDVVVQLVVFMNKYEYLYVYRYDRCIVCARDVNLVPVPHLLRTARVCVCVRARV